MFGPDKCGEDYKLHFIFRHKNPKTGEYEEKHAKKADSDLRTYYTDKKTHLYTLGKILQSLRCFSWHARLRFLIEFRSCVMMTCLYLITIMMTMMMDTCVVRVCARYSL